MDFSFSVLAPISPTKTAAARSVSPQRSDSPSHNNNPDDPATAGADPAHVRKNAKGGILVTQEELSAAFLMLDPEHTGQLTLASLKKRLGSLLPEMTAKDYRFLMNNKKEMSVEDLRELLVENEVSNYDPIFDAFRVFDPSGSGFIDEDKLRTAFVAFGLGELSDEELDVLKHVINSFFAEHDTLFHSPNLFPTCVGCRPGWRWAHRPRGLPCVSGGFCGNSKKCSTFRQSCPVNHPVEHSFWDIVESPLARQYSLICSVLMHFNVHRIVNLYITSQIDRI